MRGPDCGESREIRGPAKARDRDIWTHALAMGDLIFEIASFLEDNKLPRFVAQLKGAAAAISINIAEGTGTSSQEECEKFLNSARKSAFEIANILVVLRRRKLPDSEIIDSYLQRLGVIANNMTELQRHLV